MSTFYTPSRHMMETVAELVDELDGKFDVHTITLSLNGQHGEFDLVVSSTDEHMEEQVTTAIAHRSGGLIYGEPVTKAG